MTGGTSQANRFKISSWVNDQFEIASPRNMSGPPRGVSTMERWTSNPNSGITGDVYRQKSHIFYDASKSWFDIGTLPPRLR